MFQSQAEKLGSCPNQKPIFPAIFFLSSAQEKLLWIFDHYRSNEIDLAIPIEFSNKYVTIDSKPKSSGNTK